MSEIEDDLLAAITLAVSQADFPIDLIERIKQRLHEASPLHGMPVDRVQWVPAGQVVANDYNPNSVARQEMQLLAISIEHDGFTQPIVTVWDPDLERYVIVDGFHRFYVGSSVPEIRGRLLGRLPIVVLDKPINDRMASTVRHNRARGRHSIEGMSSMVFQLLDGGWTDDEVCNQLGLEPEELIRLKHITGFSKLFADTEYTQAWVSRRQIKLAREQDAPLL
jgi:hypothetical protein